MKYVVAYLIFAATLIAGVAAALILLLDCAEATATNKPKYKILIIDSGYDVKSTNTKLKLCPTGHNDFTTNKPRITSTDLHGTAVATIIAEKLKHVDYCAVIYNVTNPEGHVNKIATVTLALQMAVKEHFTAVNVSLSGYGTSVAERDTFALLAKNGAAVFVAAGNNSNNLDYVCDEFPVCYAIEGLYSVGALDRDTNEPAKFSNHGKRVRLWEYGTVPMGFTGNSGTSYATPRALSKFILRMDAHGQHSNTVLLSTHDHND